MFTGKWVQVSVRRAMQNAWSANQAIQASSHKAWGGYRCPILSSESMTEPLYSRISVHDIGVAFFNYKSLSPSCPSSNTMPSRCVDHGPLVLLLWSTVRSDFRMHSVIGRSLISWRRHRTCTGLHIAASVFSGTAMDRRDGESGRVGRRIFVERPWALMHSTASTNFGRSLSRPVNYF